jgi:hypothetical protein
MNPTKARALRFLQKGASDVSDSLKVAQDSDMY